MGILGLQIELCMAALQHHYMAMERSNTRVLKEK
jgi:hypothetical protein